MTDLTLHHPANRIDTLIERLVAYHERNPNIPNALDMWNRAVVGQESALLTADSLSSFAAISSTLDEWSTIILLDRSPKRVGVLTGVLLQLRSIFPRIPVSNSADVVRELKTLRPLLQSGIGETEPEMASELTKSRLETIRKEANEWRDTINTGEIDPVRKRNILRALDDLDAALKNVDIVGPNYVRDKLEVATFFITTFAPKLVKLTPAITKIAGVLVSGNDEQAP